MTKRQIINGLIKIHRNYSSEKSSTENSRMCTMWSVDDPPDILEGTEPLEKICDLLEIEINEDEAFDLYDIPIKEAAEYLYNLQKRVK